jgi:hypothetical protein
MRGVAVSTTDELWAWIYPALHDLTAERAGNRDKSWDDLRAYFVERAGLHDPSDHPLADDMIKQLDELPEGERDALLEDSSRLEIFAYEFVQRHADDQESFAPEPAAESASEAEIRALLADDPEFVEMSEESRRQLIAQVSAALDG